MNNSISISNISKNYKIYPTRNARLKEWLLPFGKKYHTNKWVLEDINLEVKSGEAVGIIGMNGAGKSTLLKIITGTTVPTTGHVSFYGSVAALLELGLGFHPDFTGRQNVFMSGQLLGYTTQEIDECMQQVEEFAEIGEAIDAPVRTYSSGMQVRLAFSVATMKRPDILIVDEALSVGDTYFQHKSFGRIKKFCQEGTTLLLVSHDAAAIQAVCDRAVLLDKGKILQTGKPEDVMNYYNAMLGGNENEPIKQISVENGKTQTISGSGEVKIISIQLNDNNNIKTEIFDVGATARLLITAKTYTEIEELTCGFLIKNRLGEPVFGTNSFGEKNTPKELSAGDMIKFTFIFPLNLGEGNYSISIALHSGNTHIEKNYEWRDLATIFTVINQTQKQFIGMTFLDAKVSIAEENINNK